MGAYATDFILDFFDKFSIKNSHPLRGGTSTRDAKLQADLVAGDLPLLVDLHPLHVGVDLTARLDHELHTLVLGRTRGEAGEHHAQREVVLQVLLQVEGDAFVNLLLADLALVAVAKGDVRRLLITGGKGEQDGDDDEVGGLHN